MPAARTMSAWCFSRRAPAPWRWIGPPRWRRGHAAPASRWLPFWSIPTTTSWKASWAPSEPDILQLHGGETPARAAEIRRRFGRQVMKAIPVAAPGDAAAALRYADSADLILFDAKAPAGATRPGGNGGQFPWGLLADVKDKVDYMLSGGLSPR